VDKRRVEILGLSTSSSSGGAYALILREADGPRRLPIIIGAFEAQAIALELEGIKPPRPMTHDLFKDVVDAMGYNVTEVTITELRDGTFYAKVSIDTAVGNEVDARPSDAVAIAVRYGAPIYVADEVLQEASFIPEGEDEEDPAGKAHSIMQPREKQLEDLQKKLDQAIGKEDYEAAARLRDEIMRLQSGD